MRILLDESLPRELAQLITGHSVSSVRLEGWAGVKIGKLLTLAAARFDVFVTANRKLEFQQNLATLPMAVVVLVCSRTRIQNIAPLVPTLLELLKHPLPRAVARVGT
jgi:predicted nuclease of predicted toxin-antitoxin system